MKPPIFFPLFACAFLITFLLPPVESIAQSTIIPSLSQSADSRQNILYSPTFRASWTMLREDIVQADIRLQRPIPLMHLLNRTPYRPPANGEWFVRSGYIENGIIDQIQGSLQESFGFTEPDLDRYKNEREGIVCYAYLQTSIRFRYPFRLLEWKFPEGETRRGISCFGLPKAGERPDPAEQARSQVRLFDYRHDDDFIIQIPDADSSKEILLAKIPFQGDLLSTVALATGRVQYGCGETLTFLDELIIPKINLSVMQHFTELEGKFLANPGFTEYFFAAASQKIDFTMNEAGATAKVNGEIIKIKGPQSRILAFDTPFLLILRSIGSTEPDLVIWIANTGFLVPVP